MIDQDKREWLASLGAGVAPRLDALAATLPPPVFKELLSILRVVEDHVSEDSLRLHDADVAQILAHFGPDFARVWHVVAAHCSGGDSLPPCGAVALTPYPPHDICTLKPLPAEVAKEST